MRKERVNLTLQLTGKDYGSLEITCDSHTFEYDHETAIFTATFVNGFEKEEGEVTEILINARSFVSKAILPQSDEEEETVTISKDEYEGLKETIAILSDPNAVTELAEAQADIDAGRTKPIDIIVGPRSF